MRLVTKFTEGPFTINHKSGLVLILSESETKIQDDTFVRFENMLRRLIGLQIISVSAPMPDEYLSLPSLPDTSENEDLKADLMQLPALQPRVQRTQRVART